MVAGGRIRSSIACVRCRRSKIKCENNGLLDSACKNCTKSGKTCAWPVSAPLPTKRPAPQTTTDELDALSTTNAGRKRLRLADNEQTDTKHTDILQVLQDIDRTLWDEILVTYQRHFVTELSFLHVPTIKSRVYDLTTGKALVSFDTQLVLLGLLALTGKYHPELANQLEAVPGDAGPETHSISDAFAKELDRSLGSFVMATSVGSVERVQALLMLGLHEWVSPSHEGLRAWMLVGAAGRMAQALKLGYETRTNSMELETSEEAVINHEIRRRTMFNCFVFDRLISCGKERPYFIRSEDIRICLPCSQEDFDMSRKAKTAYLSTETAASTTDDHCSLMGRFLRLIDTWGRISHYTNAGGRFQDKSLPPWNQDSRFYRLRQELEAFGQEIEKSTLFLGLNPSNYFRHENNSSTYILLHLLLSLCKIMLHRQYLPFIPIKCQRPSGPLDEPTFPPHTVPPGFWEDSASQLFAATKTVVDLVELCGERLPHSPLAAFVVYTASFTSLYARYFPHMDHEDYLKNRRKDQGEHPVYYDSLSSASDGITKVMFDTLTHLARYSGVASAFVSRFKEVDHYFFSIIQDHHRNLKHGVSSGLSDSEKLSVRFGGNTGGLEEWVERSDRMISNSSIVKESNTPVVLEENHPVEFVPSSLKSNCGPQLDGSTAAPVEEPLTDQHISPTSTAGGVLLGSEGYMQTSPALSAEIQPTDCDSDMPLGSTGDWSRAFLHDMYLGSASFDVVDFDFGRQF
ncbi:c6 transcription factor [Colletotrichum incanum]|uniref:C6 transcription factor n=1 Tax=Colletotrichum incanum TaxID=1573173 RepID=A0A162PIW5_COLIC|nr:c6 transcription factor [Colletotrichum incanum]